MNDHLVQQQPAAIQNAASAEAQRLVDSAVGHHVTGPEYWRSIEHYSQSSEVQKLIDEEFAGYDPKSLLTTSRRRFMQFMGASFALAGLTLTGCRRWPRETLAPFSGAPKDRTPGVPESFATVFEMGGVGVGVLAEAFDGRPIKIEGNPEHADSLGAAGAFEQASILELYDPDRSKVVIDQTSGKAAVSTREQFVDTLVANIKAGNIAVLSESLGGPTADALRAQAVAAGVKWYEYEPVSRDNESAGLALALGKRYRPVLNLEAADVAVFLDCDPLMRHPARLRYARQWSARRRTADAEGVMSRVYVAETTYTNTGAVADVRIPVRPARIAALAHAIGKALGSKAAIDMALADEAEKNFVAQVVADLQSAQGKAVVAAGLQQPPEVHALVASINEQLKAPGSTLSYLPVSEHEAGRPTHLESIKSLAADIKSGAVKSLIIIGGNPAFDAPADLDLAKAIASVPYSARLGLYYDETSKVCKWHAPRAHYLEAWGDSRGWDGSISLAQPIIEPLYNGWSAIELMALLGGASGVSGYDLVRKTAQSYIDKLQFERVWKRSLHDGVVAKSARDAQQVRVGPMKLTQPAAAPAEFDITFLSDASMYDGRHANSGWLQELPDPITKMTWDNPALISKSDADRAGIKTGDIINIKVAGRSLDIAAYIAPGQAKGAVTLLLGYGRTASGHIGTDTGFNTYSLRTAAGMDATTGTISVTGRDYLLAMTQDHFLLDEIGFDAREQRAGSKGHSGRIVREGTLAEYAEHLKSPDGKTTKPGFVSGEEEEDRSLALQLFDQRVYEARHAWGMTIDMNACIGCMACVVACQAENNIPVVGKEQVNKNREMHWLRIDRYYKSAPGRGDNVGPNDPNPQIVFMPLMCVHCENAPCEQVCPVAATMHDSEGLNTMVYNRCIGTRYCSNNCPYKVRRFNYLDWQSKDPRGFAKPWLGIPDDQQEQSISKIKQMVFNPDVTVRMRGVMEKCTYCVQRIHNVKIRKRNLTPGGIEQIIDGDIVTACQQTCPTNAIIFGDLKDTSAEVVRGQQSPRAYPVLEDLNTRPRTLHLAKLRNAPVTAAASHEA